MLFSGSAFSAGIVEPVKWKWKIEQKEGSNEAEIIFVATIDKGWHIYSRFIGDGLGEVIGTAFEFIPNDSYSLIDSTLEGEPLSKFDDALNIQVLYFKNQASFTQKVLLNSPEKFTIEGSIVSSACDENGCLPPEFTDFILTEEGGVSVDVGEVTGSVNCEENPYMICNVDMSNPAMPCGEEQKSNLSLWSIFLL
ncbi:MAG: hypothetical protein IH948_08130, partial [Bacteroidetes bacterium]|nr:hypothetical protein [Bacteroidota bacterium]